jgi:hypothetical protein
MINLIKVNMNRIMVNNKVKNKKKNSEYLLFLLH